MDGLLVSGSIVYDQIVSPVVIPAWNTTLLVDPVVSSAGGNGGTTAYTAAKLGVRVRLTGATGSDAPGAWLAAQLEEAGVDTSFVERLALPSAQTVALVAPDGARILLHHRGANTGAFAGPLDFARHARDGFSHYHLGTLFNLPNLRREAPQTLARARQCGLRTSLDLLFDPERRWMQDLAPCLPWIDTLFLNEQELEAIGASVEELLGAGPRLVILKRGAQGASAYAPDAEWHAAGHQVAVRDTTGAGDCFVGGFLAAQLDGASAADALAFANAAAALSVTEPGQTAALRDGAAARRWISARLQK